jgi:hypothetical protein
MSKNCKVISVVLYGTVSSKLFRYWYFTKLSFQNCTQMANSVFDIAHNYHTQIIFYKNSKTLPYCSQHTNGYPDNIILHPLYQFLSGCCRQTFNINSQLL